MASSAREDVAHEFLPFVRVYKDGTVERLIDPPQVPPSLDDPHTGVSSKDVVLDPTIGVSARIYLPPHTSTAQKHPILLYFHGGGFCVGSAFSAADHSYMNSVSSQARVLAISVEYRLVPKYPLPAAYEDGFSALRWVASHKSHGPDPWLADYGNFDRIFIGGESAGGNIAHNVVMRAGREILPNGVKVTGLFLAMPYFWGPEPIGSEPKTGHESRVSSRIWDFVYPSCPDGLDSPHVNPFAHGAPSLATIGCRRVLVCLAGKDELRERGKMYVEALKESGFEGEVEEFEAEDEGHVFHIFNPHREAAKEMLQRLATFIQK
ncbi:hypothetical protein Nepgr_010251 [Nepenthes gracilis]|uniref:Alpha/beta hydrolase fold-3 domain-containing protein n=1 Tax=Nepenthes gracilis TaxID=150966 RepID=A0AAD3SCQ8_NEPGR|nr:hypothetical protein Nepgr_010251 [Nepenthes gracilis]